MKKAIRILCFLLCICFSVSLLAACGGKDNNSSDGSSSDASSEVVTAEEIVNTADVSFTNAEGESTYRVVKNEKANESVINNTVKICEAIGTKFNVTVKNVPDTESGENVAEILVGETNRPETESAKKLLLSEGIGRDDEYIIATINDDIVIYGITDASLTAAVDYFCNTYITGGVITGGIHYFYTNAEGYKEVKLFGKSSLFGIQIVRPIYNVSYLTQVETDAMKNKILSLTGFGLVQINDQIASTTGNQTDNSGTLTPTSAAEYEIIIGNCVRDGVNKNLERFEYEIRIEDKKIYLNGGSSEATAMAVSEFAKLFDTNNEITAANSVISGDYNETVKGYDNKTTYLRVWGDDFDGSDSADGIDYSIWEVAWDAVSGYKKGANGRDLYRGSSELKNNYVKNGYAYQECLVTDDAYYGGRFDTMYKMQYRYGFIETSTLHPKGDTMWSCLWTNGGPGGLSDNGPVIDESRMYYQETDINECYGSGIWVEHNTFAWPTTLAKRQGVEKIYLITDKIFSKDDRGYYMDFHTYGFEWIDETHVKFSIDGNVTVDRTLREGGERLAYSQEVYVMLSVNSGAIHIGTPPADDDEAWTKYNKFISDYVNLYQKEGQDLWLNPGKEYRAWEKVR